MPADQSGVGPTGVSTAPAVAEADVGGMRSESGREREREGRRGERAAL